MKLYLSSFRLGNHPEQLVRLLSGKKKTAVIANAIDGATEDERRLGVERELNDLHSLGLHAEECDLREYFGKWETSESLRILVVPHVCVRHPVIARYLLP